MTHPAQRHEDLYQQLLAELTEREGESLVYLPEAANDARFEVTTRPSRNYGALSMLLLAVASAIVVGSSPLAVGGALALMTVLAAPLVAVERGSARLLVAAIVGGTLATAAAYGLSPMGATAAAVAAAAVLGLWFGRAPATS
ncbi:hypothetical protein [Algiphilus aromaticivorans]|jgi:hypothetical protein|uniref:hypothetical protein n=1 Tax=Algiphilus aromaticivorans TaxID=382454 RepID=UPI0005C184A7|nr:hypothetical protein [Algiphilus aromaticivorans]